MRALTIIFVAGVLAVAASAAASLGDVAENVVGASVSTGLGHHHHHDCLHACKKFDEKKIPGCDLKGDGCKCIFHHKYRVSFTDPSTGVGYRSGWTSKDKAGEEAIYGLFQKDRGCNCHSNNSMPLGTCHMSFKACFFFQSVADVSASKTAFQVYGQLTSPKESPTYTAIAANSSAITTAAAHVIEQIVAFDPSCAPTAEQAADLAAFALRRA